MSLEQLLEVCRELGEKEPRLLSALETFQRLQPGATELQREAARCYGNGFVVDEDARVSAVRSDGLEGVWVQGWVYVPANFL